METVMSVVAWVTAHGVEVLAAAYLLLNTVIAVLHLIPGDQLGEESGKGVLGKVRQGLDFLSRLLQPGNAVGAAKAALTKKK